MIGELNFGDSDLLPSLVVIAGNSKDGASAVHSRRPFSCQQNAPLGGAEFHSGGSRRLPDAKAIIGD